MGYSTLKDCIEQIKRANEENVFLFEPGMGGFDIKKPSQEDFPFQLTIPFETGTKDVVILTKQFKKLAVFAGMGAKHFDKLCELEQYDKIIDIVKPLLSESTNIFNLIANENRVYGVSCDKDVLDYINLINIIRNVFITLSGLGKFKLSSTNDDVDENGIVPIDDVDENILVPFFEKDETTLIIGFCPSNSKLTEGKNYRCGFLLYADRIGIKKTEILPCVFYKNNSSWINGLMLFDIKGLLEAKTTIKDYSTLQEDVTELLYQISDFFSDNLDKIDFSVCDNIIDVDHYLEHLLEDTHLPKKLVTKHLIEGRTISSIADSIKQLVQQEDIFENKKLYNKLIRSLGYICYYQNSFCKSCMKTQKS